MIMEDYYFVDAYVENWILFIDVADRSFLEFDIEAVKKIMEKLSINFPQTVEKIFLISPSLSLQLSWGSFEGSLI
jgi:CRAL/TRIO domain